MLDFNKPMELSELSYWVQNRRDLWWRHLIGGELVQANMAALELAALAVLLQNKTATLVKEHYADPEAALRGNSSPAQQTETGDRG